MLEHVKNYRFNTHPGEFKRPNYLKINNTHLSVEEVAGVIKEKFDL
jgi:hypothetical protein